VLHDRLPGDRGGVVVSGPTSLPDAATRIRQLERRLDREQLRRQEAERISESGIRRLYDLTTDLDRMVAERTAESVAAAERAEAALESRRALLRMITHEVLTPLHQISGMLELVDASRLGDEDRHRLATSAVAAEWVVRLVRDVADLVATESGPLMVVPVRCHPAEHLDRVADHWRPIAARRGLLLVLELDSTAATEELETDPVRTRRVVEELLGAAVDRARSRVVVRASVSPPTSPEGSAAGGDGAPAGPAHLEVVVDDDGDVGPEDLRALQGLLAGELDASPGQGAGLGILLAQRFAAALGGSVELGRSELGGASWTFRLPVRQSASR
jgi:two-component system, NarL family, capsular synthesis sensor histidine kinase RcsC